MYCSRELVPNRAAFAVVDLKSDRNLAFWA